MLERYATDNDAYFDLTSYYSRWESKRVKLSMASTADFARMAILDASDLNPGAALEMVVEYGANLGHGIGEGYALVREDLVKALESTRRRHDGSNQR